jgi:hypothetical protein
MTTGNTIWIFILFIMWIIYIIQWTEIGWKYWNGSNCMNTLEYWQLSVQYLNYSKKLNYLTDGNQSLLDDAWLLQLRWLSQFVDLLTGVLYSCISQGTQQLFTGWMTVIGLWEVRWNTWVSAVSVARPAIKIQGPANGPDDRYWIMWG